MPYELITQYFKTYLVKRHSRGRISSTRAPSARTAGDLPKAFAGPNVGAADTDIRKFVGNDQWRL